MHYKTHTRLEARMRFDVVEVIRDKNASGHDAFTVKHLIGTFDADTAKWH